MRSRDRIAKLEIRQSGSLKASIHETNPPAFTDWDPLHENPIIDAALVCRGCPLSRDCNPNFSAEPKGFFRLLSLVVKGDSIVNSDCALRSGLLPVQSRGPDFRRLKLNELLTSRTDAGQKIYSLKVS